MKTDFEIRAKALSRMAGAWLKPNSPWMRKAVRKLPITSGFSPKMVRLCLEKTFAAYTGKNLRDWISKLQKKNKFSVSRKKKQVLILSPSTVFAATWQAFAASWAADCKVLIKPSRSDPLFPELLRESAWREAGIRISLVKKIPRTFLAENSNSLGVRRSVIAYGNDRNLKNIQNALHPSCNWIAFGTRISVGIVDWISPKSRSSLLRKAALDSILYETQGCLSPQVFFVLGGADGTARNFARQLAMEIKRNDRIIPASRKEEDVWETESFWQHWRFRESQKQVEIDGDHVFYDASPHFEPLGMKRMVLVKPLPILRNIQRILGPWEKKISTLAVSDQKVGSKVQKLFSKRKDIRICEIGMMHEPLPDWANGGVSLLEVL